jgi:hypothetical protein
MPLLKIETCFMTFDRKNSSISDSMAAARLTLFVGAHQHSCATRVLCNPFSTPCSKFSGSDMQAKNKGYG